MLIRWYRVLPSNVREAWAATPEQFPAQRLSDLADVAGRGDANSLEVRLAGGVAHGQRGSKRTSTTDKPNSLTRGRLLALAECLAEVGDEALAGNARASTVYALLVAIGSQRGAAVEGIVGALRSELADLEMGPEDGRSLSS